MFWLISGDSAVWLLINEAKNENDRVVKWSGFVTGVQREHPWFLSKSCGEERFITVDLFHGTQKGEDLTYVIFQNYRAQVKFSTVIIKNILDRHQRCSKYILKFQKAEFYKNTYSHPVRLEVKYLEVLLQ